MRVHSIRLALAAICFSACSLSALGQVCENIAIPAYFYPSQPTSQWNTAHRKTADSDHESQQWAGKFVRPELCNRNHHRAQCRDWLLGTSSSEMLIAGHSMPTRMI